MTNDIVEQNREIISVGELNRSAKYLLENNFSNVSVLGEISNFCRKCCVLYVFCGSAGNRVDGEGDKGDRVNPIPRGF
mgnify:CR=1 FL=1